MKGRIRIDTILLCSLILGLAPASSQEPPAFDSDLQVLQRLAEERYAEGDLVRAAQLYQELAAKQSDSRSQAKALFTAAWLLELSGDKTEALESLTRSLRIDPDQPLDASLYNREFELLYQRALDIALSQRRRDSAAKTGQAATEMEAERYPQARTLLEQAIELDPANPAALYNLALLDLRAGATPKAIGYFERVVSLSYKEATPKMSQLRARALASMGVIYHQQGRTADAEQSFFEATQANPEEASPWSNLGLIYLEQERYEAATSALERALELHPEDREITRAAAHGLQVSGRPGEAVILLTSHLQRHPDDAELWLALARIEQDRGNLAEAAGALEKSMDADPQNLDGHAISAAVQLASLHLQQQDLEAATAAANLAVGWNRSQPDAWSVLGQAQLAAGQLPQATASLNRAADLDPESVDRQLALGRALMASRQLSQAEAVFLKALTIEPNSKAASENLQSLRSQLANERAIVAGEARPRKPIPPKKIGLEFAGIDYKDLQLRGALVKQVNKKSPAARAGLRKGDLILWIGEYSVLSDKDFYQFLKRSPPGRVLAIEYLRDGRIYDAQIELR